MRASFLLRLALAFVFTYAAVASFFAPENWIGFFPQFLSNNIPPPFLLTGFSIIEILLAIWLLSGWLSKWAALFSAALLAGIVVFNLGALDLVFRDVGLLLAAIALFQSER